MSGSVSSRRVRATRRRSPPESTSHRRFGRRAAQGVHGQLEVAVQVPGVDLVELLLEPGLLGDQGVEVGVRLGEPGVDLVELCQHFHDRLDRLTHHFDHGLGLVELRLLLEHADGVALAHGDLADVVLVDTGHDAQQGGLAGPVQAEHADLGTVVEAQRDVAQDLFVGGMDAPDAHHGVDDLGVGGHEKGSRDQESGLVRERLDMEKLYLVFNREGHEEKK